MRGLNATRLLSAWERGRARPPPERALTLLEAACAGDSRDALSKLPIGARDSRLLALREAAFGPRLDAVVSCPSCRETLELGLRVPELRIGGGAEPADLPVVESGGYEVRYRLPTGEDLEEIEGADGVADARRVLLERCLLSVRLDGEAASPGDLPESVIEAVAAAMERADPQADVELSLDCPACGHRWTSALDIAAYLWSEVDGWAKRTLYEIHALASAYGWREDEILALSARRRRDYLELIGR